MHGYREIMCVPDQFMSDDDKFVIKTGIRWFIRLLDRGVPLTEEAFRFCFSALNANAGRFVAETRDLIARVGPGLLEPAELAESLEFFENSPEDYAQLADNLATLIAGGRTSLASLLAGLMRGALEVRLAELDKSPESDLERASRTLQRLFRLNDVETTVLAAVHLLESMEALDAYFDSHLCCRESGKSRFLATILDLQPSELRDALSGKIARLKLLDNVGALSVDQTVENIFSTTGERTKALFYKELDKELLPLDYFPLDDGAVEHILALLAADDATPTHILLYGEPGAGKTSFAAAVAHALGQTAYCVSSPENGDAAARRNALEACLNLTRNGRDGLVVVDEADNLLNTAYAFLFSGERPDKGWLNEFLERPGVRTLWVANDTSGIPDSVMRRFAYSVKFRKLGRDQRRNIWRRVAAKNKVRGLLTEDRIEWFAERYPLSAGSIDLAVKKARKIAGRQRTPFLRAVELSLAAGRELLDGERPLRREDAVERGYSLDGLNLTTDVPALLRRLDAFNAYLDNGDEELRVNMNLLFYGPPGTGKTEMSRYLSRRLKRELMVRRASDLLSKWVGESEQRIAETFRRAERRRAVLVIDEADSLLFSRDKAQRSWETSMVNEFLTRMEHFGSLLICTTNRLEELDAASLRRFNHKIGFDFLTGEGNLLFYDRLLRPLTAARADDEALRPLRRLRNLTPGDFKIVRDRFALSPKDEVGHADLIESLVEESKLKDAVAHPRAIGFLPARR